MDIAVKVIYTTTIAGGHNLSLPYKSKCANLHGHNWKIKVTVKCMASDISEEGMVVDFNVLKEIIHHLDHKLLNDFIPQPTAENIALYLYTNIGEALPPHRWIEQIVVEESNGHEVVIEPQKNKTT